MNIPPLLPQCSHSWLFNLGRVRNLDFDRFADIKEGLIPNKSYFELDVGRIRSTKNRRCAQTHKNQQKANSSHRAPPANTPMGKLSLSMPEVYRRVVSPEPWKVLNFPIPLSSQGHAAELQELPALLPSEVTLGASQYFTYTVCAFERSRWRDGRFACYAPHVMLQGRASNCDFRVPVIFLSQAKSIGCRRKKIQFP